MRLSLDDFHDPVKGPLVRRVEIYLDGVRQWTCTMADEEAGVLERYLPVWQGGGREQVTGHVVIVDPLAVR